MRGEAVASLIIIAVNIFGGIIIGVTRHGMPLADAADVYTRLSVGDGLVAQIPALIVSLAAGLLVSKGGTRGSAEKAVLSQLGAYPRALFVASSLLFGLALVPGLPFIPFAALGGLLAFIGYTIPKQLARKREAEAAVEREKQEKLAQEARESVKESLRTYEVELAVGKQLAQSVLRSHQDLSLRINKIRRKFAQRLRLRGARDQVRRGSQHPRQELPDQDSRHGGGHAGNARERDAGGDRRRPKPDVPCDEVREPAFGLKAVWISEAYVSEIKREGFHAIDSLSVMLTHLSEVISNNLAQLLSYKDMRALLDRLDPEYKRLIEDICPSQISYSGLQAVLKLLLAERVSVRNLHLILEAIAEIVPHARRSEQVVEHVRMRMAQQICGDLSEGGTLNVLRLGAKWDLTFHESLKRDAKGEVVEFDIDPRLVEQFGTEASAAVRERMKQGATFVLVTAPDARPYVRMIIERMFPSLPVLSHVEIARGAQIKSLGTIS